MAGLTRDAPAKLNLRLRVGPRRADGYHDVRSLMVALEGLSDTVHVAPAAGRSVTCPGLHGGANLAWTALDALERHIGRPVPCAVTIEKRIPTQAGLGGGSSDAATVLVAANRLFDLGLNDGTLESIAAQVGSDVPFFVRGGCQWAEGRGELLTPAEPPEFAAVIAMPDVGLSTAAVYGRFDELPPSPPVADGPAPPAMPALARWVRNDLWPAASALEPRLGDLAEALTGAGAEATLLCGSGAAVAGLVRDPDEAAAVLARLTRSQPTLRLWSVRPER